MSISYFLSAQDRGAPAEAPALDELRMALARTPQLRLAEVHRPASVQTYHRDGEAPRLALRLVFDTIEALESQLVPGGHLCDLATSSLWRHVAGERVTQQAMLTRTFSPLSRAACDKPWGEAASYLVHYPGEAQDFNAWLRYYVGHHPQIMCHYPGVRQVQVFTRVDWCDAMPCERVSYMQRNQLTFASPEALVLGIESEIRVRMRADHQNFPPYSGGSVHYPMLTSIIDRR